MKKIIACLSVFTVFYFAWSVPHIAQTQAINHGGKIETKYDGFNAETVMRLKKMQVSCSGFKDNFKDGCVSIDVTLHCPGTQINFVRQVTVRLVFESKNWIHGSIPWDQRELTVVADDETIRLGRMTLLQKGDMVMSEKVVETLEMKMSYDVFKKVAAAQSVEIQVGKSRLELREKNRAALRDLNNRVLAVS